MDKKADTERLSDELMGFIENIALFYEQYGIPRIGGRMFGLFLVTASPLSAEKISGILKASRSSVSTNVRGLILNGWVEKTTSAGDRTEYYRLCPTAWEKVLQNRMRGLVPLRRMTEQAQDAMPKDNPARDQLKKMIEWVELQIQGHETMIRAWNGAQNRKKP